VKEYTKIILTVTLFSTLFLFFFFLFLLLTFLSRSLLPEFKLESLEQAFNAQKRKFDELKETRDEQTRRVSRHNTFLAFGNLPTFLFFFEWCRPRRRQPGQKISRAS